MRLHRPLLTLALPLLLLASRAHAQTITTPPSGDNQRCSVTQGIGLVNVRIEYSSPDVHGPGGEDRAGHIWGELVPYGLADLGFNECKECPWRAGANQTTVFAVSHDVLVEGQPLPAGAYGLHMIPGKDEWTVIFNRNSDSWGSYFYDPRLDALRVKVKPAKSDYHEWLTYEFTDRMPDHTTALLKWENLQLPITVKVPNIQELYFEKIDGELRSAKGFEPVELVAGSQFCMQNKFHMDAAERWAVKAVSSPGLGTENFNTLSNLALVQIASGKSSEGWVAMDKAMQAQGADAPAVHQLGRQLQGMGKAQDALRVFEGNFKRFKGAWPTGFGLARGYEGVGEKAKALAAAKLALPKAPNDANKRNVQSFIDRLEKK